TTPAAIGARGDSSFCSFFGTLDEVSVYNRALSATEIQRIYAANSAGKCVGTIPPIIVTQPTNKTVLSGSSLTFTALAAGSPTLGYQWLFNGTNVIPGATSTSLTLANVSLAQAGNYSIQVTNAFGSALSSNALLTVLPPCTPVPSGLIGWWKGDGNGIDSVAGNNAYAMPNITFTPGMVLQAFACNPVGYTGVQIHDQPYYILTNSLTVEAWARPRGNGYVIFFRGDHRPGLDPYTMSMAGNNVLNFGVTDTNGNTASISAPLVFNQWWHLVGTLDGASGNLSLYTNGVLAAQTNTPVRPFGALIPAQTPGIGIGNVNDGGNNFPFVGDIDEVRLYNRALSQAEVQSIYLAGGSGECTNTIPPVILLQPSNQTASAASTVTFSPLAAGSPTLSYQWFFNGTNVIAGATNTSLTLSNVSFPQVGSYSLLVTNAFGSALSSNAVLTILAICTPVPSGLIGWWKGDSNGVDSVAANNAFAIPNVTFTNGVVNQAFDCDFKAFFSEGVEIADKPWYVLTNSLSVEAWIRPRGDGYCIFYRGDRRLGFNPYMLSMQHDNILSFSITDASNTNANVLAPLAYNQWWHVAGTWDGSSGLLTLYTNGVLAAQTSTTLRPLGNLIPSQAPGLGIGNVFDGGKNYPFTGDIDEVSLYNRALTINEIQAIYYAGAGGKCTNTIPPVILLPPTNRIARPGDLVTLTALAAGSGTLNYQWQFNGASLVDGGRITGSLTPSLSISGAQTNDSGNYQIVVTNNYGAVTSQVAVLAVGVPPQIITQPTNRAVLVGSNSTFIVSATGTAPLSYQWWFNGNKPLGPNNPVLTINNAQFTNIGDYYVVVTNYWGAATSVTAYLSVALPPRIQSVTLSNGQLTITWNGATGFTYQLQYNTNLAQPYWSNLGGPIFATGNIVTGHDLISSGPQRFYRVSLLP
ncbi:MAG TPA: LamG-like jellyroll fold domain-containing protein, partial [Candidatus Binatia bacterium]|nr:LamG-like jellyroll fold domain-containing protein [Candidatus Binatia bacterium]